MKDFYENNKTVLTIVGVVALGLVAVAGADLATDGSVIGVMDSESQNDAMQQHQGDSMDGESMEKDGDSMEGGSMEEDGEAMEK